MSVQNRKNPLIHENRQRGSSQSAWERSFACIDIHPLIICPWTDPDGDDGCF